jgi:hypothetical protein
MDFAAFRCDTGIPSVGYITEITSTNNGVVLSPDPLGGGFQDVSGSIALAVDLKTVNGNFALGFNNWQSAVPIGSSNLVIGNVNMGNMIGDENIAIGNNNMDNVIAPSVLNNIAIGSRVMQRMASGNHDNISIGQAIGPEIGSNNIIMGQDSGYYLVGSDNIIEGNNIASGNTVVGSNNILLSKDVFTLASSQVESTILLGNDNMTATLISDSDIVIGSNNLQQMGNSNHNLIIGHNILTDATIAGNDNIYIGRRLNQNVNDSITNILIGTDIEMTDNKRNCIVIGQTITLPAETSDQTTIIGGSHIALGNNITVPTYKLESGQSRCMHNLNQTSAYDFRYMEFLNSGPLNLVGVDNNVFTFNLNQLQFPAGIGFRMLTLEIVFNCTYYVEPAGFDPSDVYHSSSCTLGLIYSSQATSWKLMQLQSGYQEPSNNVDCNNNNNQVAFNMAVPYIDLGLVKAIPYQIVQDQLFLSGANFSTLTYNIQMNNTFANSALGGYSCMYKFYTSMGID